MSFEMTIKISGLDDLSMRMGESHAGSDMAIYYIVTFFYL